MTCWRRDGVVNDVFGVAHIRVKTACSLCLTATTVIPGATPVSAKMLSCARPGVAGFWWQAFILMLVSVMNGAPIVTGIIACTDNRPHPLPWSTDDSWKHCPRSTSRHHIDHSCCFGVDPVICRPYLRVTASYHETARPQSFVHSTREHNSAGSIYISVVAFIDERIDSRSSIRSAATAVR